MGYSTDNYLLELNEDFERQEVDCTGHGLRIVSNKNLSSHMPMVISSPLDKKHNRAIKRLFDIIISVTVMSLVFWWLLPILALLIKIDSPGPVLFVQKRNKKGGKLFYCLKLRTMRVNSSADVLPASSNDARITGIGKFLRLSHLDELPQFINVLIGDMSVVGPRPHMVTENVKFKKVLNAYNDRHFVKPGITGLAQSFGFNGPINDFYHLDKKIAYDIFYIKNWSAIMDVKIFIRTIGMIFKKLKPVQ
jgi:putative colanic acid biosynthesis UDP-glucose lipid carrier transferase